nr:UvrB/UvrC motif-containing protein [Streptomyces clavuligerus]
MWRSSFFSSPTSSRSRAADLQFEIAARLRDEVGELKKELRQMKEAGLA